MSKHRADVATVEGDLEQVVQNILHDRLGHMIADVEFRLGRLTELERRHFGADAVASYDAANAIPDGSVYVEDIVSTKHAITGYTVTANSPGLGSIAWTNVHVVYNGVDYTAADGSTALRYTWFVKPGTGTAVTLISSNTKPTVTDLGVGGALIFVNNGGTPNSVIEETISSVVADSSIDSTAIIAGAVGSTQLGSGAVTAGKIGAGAINAANQFGTGVVDSTALGANAVVAGKVAAGAINAANQFGAGVVDSTALGSNAVTSGKLADGAVSTSAKFGTGVVDSTALGANAVVAGKVAAGAINASNQFSTGVVDSTALGANAVIAGKIANGAVSASAQIGTGVVAAGNLGAGAVTPAKLNIQQHVLY